MRTILLLMLAASRAEASARYQIRWASAHEPAGVPQAAREFARLVSAETKGDVEVKVIASTQTPRQIIRKVAAGEIEMAQSDTAVLGRYSRELWVLDLPYLFHSHEHAAGVLDGDIGRELLASLQAHNLRGLAFIDGGYRILMTVSREIRKPADLNGLRVRTTNTPVSKAILRALGAEPVVSTAGPAETSESTLEGRFETDGMPVINDTRHSLSVAAVVVNEKFFASLPREHQDALIRSALKTAGVERRRSAEAGAQAKTKAIAAGKKVVMLTDAQRAEFVAEVKPVYKSFPRLRELVERIQDAR